MLAVVAILAACTHPVQTADEYDGLPGGPPACTWGSRYGMRQESSGECITLMKRYRCFRNRIEEGKNWHYQVSCAPYKITR